jgi:hypothetical protein
MDQNLSRAERFSSVRFASCSDGDADHAAVESPNSGRPQANILDRTACITGLWKVSHSRSPVEDDGDSTQDVLQSLLGGEGDGNFTDTESWQDGGGVKTEAVQGDQQSGEKGQQLDRPAAQTND